ncbi:MAG: hypothetical protein Q8O67_20460 [Deltaproteobacteria bacterium]|nr:hypothetical protein [Deltaproteobacteria bacterium]
MGILIGLGIAVVVLLILSLASGASAPKWMKPKEPQRDVVCDRHGTYQMPNDCGMCPDCWADNFERASERAWADD